MPNYKLSYFNVKGRAELIRLTFHASGIKFVDHRVSREEWPALKPKIPHGSLPSLEVDGTIFGQSIAIARYAAREGGLAGKTPLEALRADQFVDNVLEFGQSFIKLKFEKDEAKKAELQKEFSEKIVPSFLGKLNGELESSGRKFFVGTSLTWADLAVFHNLDLIDTIAPAEMDKYKKLKEFKKRIEDIPKISAYLKARPKLDY